MSHISRVKTELKDLAFIMKALDDLGLKYEQGEDLEVPEVIGPIELVIHLPRSRHPIALVRNKDNSFSFEGEQSVMRMAADQELLQKINQRYAYHVIKDKLFQQGFHLETESQGAQDSIHLTLRRNA